jgi:hypothetical protein
MLSEAEQKLQVSEGLAAMGSQQLSLRWKLLQVVGAAVIALSILIEWPAPSDPLLPDTQSFLLVLGVIVFVAGLLANSDKRVR